MKNIIDNSIIMKGGTNTESFYEYLLSKYIAPYFTILFKKIGIENPNFITFISFFIIILAGILTLYMNENSSFVYRLTIALLIQFSFIFDCSDGQLARLINRTSKLGAWLDRIFDRVGEFFIYFIFGLVAYRLYNRLIFLDLGIITGFCLSIFTLSMVASTSIIYSNKVNELMNSNNKEKSNLDKDNNKRNKKVTRRKDNILFILSRIFFFLNFGIGERYLYLSFFILISRIDIMLYITSFLSFLRMLSMSFFIGKKLKKIDIEIK